MYHTQYIVTYYQYDQDGNCKDGPKIFGESFYSEKEANDAITEDMERYKKSMKDLLDMVIIEPHHVHDLDYQNGIIYNCIKIKIDSRNLTCTIP